MGPTSLFSRAKPGKSTPKKIRGFLALPGEIRNQIYGYCFRSELYCEIAAKGSQFKEQKVPTFKLCTGVFQLSTSMFKSAPQAKEETPTIRISRPLGKYNVVQGLQTNWCDSLHALHLVCKQVSAETLAFLYHKTTFVFDAPKRITTFVSVVTKPKLEHITKLHLHYTTYGCPKWAKDSVWQHKHSKSWLRACSAVSRKLVNLHQLKVWMHVNDGHVRLDLRQMWVLPLLQFRRLTRSPPTTANSPQSDAVKVQRPGLEIVEIKLFTKWSGYQFDGNQELAKASEDLHRLFANALCYAILGKKEEDAMAEYNEAWNGKYNFWQYHLSYGKTGW